MVLEKLKLLEINQGSLQAQLNTTQHELINSREELNNTRELLSQVLHDRNNSHQAVTSLEARLNHSVSLMFYNQTTFTSHRYYVSFPLYKSVVEAADVCAWMGGYLVELNSQAEYDVIVQLIKSASAPAVRVFPTLVGMTDLGYEGHWRWVNSGRAVNFTKWAAGEPDDGEESNCALLHATSFLMYDAGCFGSYVKFVCEVE